MPTTWSWSPVAPATCATGPPMRPRGCPGPARIGSFTNALAVHAPCPVLVARTAVV